MTVIIYPIYLGS